jgi:hypothetical protein
MRDISRQLYLENATADEYKEAIEKGTCRMWTFGFAVIQNVVLLLVFAVLHIGCF